MEKNAYCESGFYYDLKYLQTEKSFKTSHIPKPEKTSTEALT